MTTIEGGALVVNDSDEAKRIDPLRFHGISYLPDRTRDVAFPAGKFNLPDVNARIGVAEADLYPHFSLTGVAGLESLNASTFLTAPSRYFSRRSRPARRRSVASTRMLPRG